MSEDVIYMSHRLWHLHITMPSHVQSPLICFGRKPSPVTNFPMSLSLSRLSAEVQAPRSPPKTLLSYIYLPPSSFHYRITHWTLNMTEITALQPALAMTPILSSHTPNQSNYLRLRLRVRTHLRFKGMLLRTRCAGGNADTKAPHRNTQLHI